MLSLNVAQRSRGKALLTSMIPDVQGALPGVIHLVKTVHFQLRQPASPPANPIHAPHDANTSIGCRKNGITKSKDEAWGGLLKALAYQQECGAFCH